MTKIVGMIALFISVMGVATAGNPTVPEINPALGLSALALLSGGLLVIRGRKK